MCPDSRRVRPGTVKIVHATAPFPVRKGKGMGMGMKLPLGMPAKTANTAWMAEPCRNHPSTHRSSRPFLDEAGRYWPQEIASGHRWRRESSKATFDRIKIWLARGNLLRGACVFVIQLAGRRLPRSRWLRLANAVGAYLAFQGRAPAPQSEVSERENAGPGVVPCRSQSLRTIE